MKYEQYNRKYWYCITPNNRLYMITDKAQIRRKIRVKQLRRSRSVIYRLGFKVI